MAGALEEARRSGVTQSDERAAIYDFGRALFEMLTGRAVSPARRRVEPPRLEKFLVKCLAPDPAERYQSVAEMKAALDKLQKGRNIRIEYVFIAIGTLTTALGLVLLMMEFPFRQRLTEKDVLVVADFDNTTRDTVFDKTLRTALSLQLEQSPFLKILSDEKVRQYLARMGRPLDSRITTPIAHDICTREGQSTMLGGAISDLGSAFEVTVQAINCRTGATNVREQLRAASNRDQVLAAISLAATRLRARLGEPRASVEKWDRPLEQSATASLAAMQAYSFGVERRSQGSELAAVAFFTRATELDPDFVSAWLALYFSYSNLAAESQATEAIQKAFALRNRANEFERLQIQALHDRSAGDWNQALASAELLVREYPRSDAAHYVLGSIQEKLGRLDQVLREYQTAADNPVYSSALIDVYSRLRRFPEARAAAKTDSPLVHRSLLRLAYAEGDAAAAQKEIQWFAGKPEEHLSLLEQSRNAREHGDGKSAAALDARAAALARQHNLK